MHHRAPLLLFLLLPVLSAQTSERHIEYGFEQRVRSEQWNNILDYNSTSDDERGQVRYRTRLWFQSSLTSTIDVRVGVGQETNQIFQPSTVTHFDEVFFETAYIDFRKLFVRGLSLRFGRQNLARGEGFLFLEGDPYDGSRSVYNNAAVLAYESGKSKLEFIGIYDPAYDRYLPRIHDVHRELVEWDESALGAYFTTSRIPKTSLESYYVYKREFGDRRPVSHPQFQGDRYVYTAGGRAVRKFPRNFSATGEWAWQFGHQRPAYDIRAWGGYAYVKRTFGTQSRSNLIGGYWAMSGDDPNTRSRIENWDPLFARWPKWSELYIYSQFREVGPSYWTNIRMTQLEANVSPWKPFNLRGTWYHMGAFHPFKGNPRFFSSGTTRGDMLQARADLTLGKHWRGHALYEHMIPGGFYTGRNPGFFFRLEITYLYSGAHSF